MMGPLELQVYSDSSFMKHAKQLLWYFIWQFPETLLRVQLTFFVDLVWEIPQAYVCEGNKTQILCDQGLLKITKAVWGRQVLAITL